MRKWRRGKPSKLPQANHISRNEGFKTQPCQPTQMKLHLQVLHNQLQQKARPPSHASCIYNRQFRRRPDLSPRIDVREKRDPDFLQEAVETPLQNTYLRDDASLTTSWPDYRCVCVCVSVEGRGVHWTPAFCVNMDLPLKWVCSMGNGALSLFSIVLTRGIFLGEKP